MDLLEAKSRVAEALVESIFRRARYELQPYRPPDAPLRLGREDFTPDFQAGDFLVEVKYRPSVEQFLSVENQRGDRSVLNLARRHWPALYFVLVTDRPEPGRSCFQAVPFPSHPTGGPFRAVDLGSLPELRIFDHNIRDHEELIRRIFVLLSGG